MGVGEWIFEAGSKLECYGYLFIDDKKVETEKNLKFSIFIFQILGI